MRLISILAACLVVTLSTLLVADALAQRGSGGAPGGGPGGGPIGSGGGMQPGAGGGNPQGGARAGGARGPANRNPPARPPQRPPPVTAMNVRIEMRVYTFEPTGEKMSYALFLPRKLDRKKPAPLLIALHGKGVPPETIMGTFVPGADRYGYIVAAPMGYNTSGWYGLQGPTDAETARLSELDVMNVLGIVRAEFNIDPRRIYIAGHSMGGIGAVYLAAKYPDIWAAVGAMSPGFTRGSMQNEKIGGYNAAPVIVEHGTRDEVAPIDVVRDWIAGLKERNVPMKYYEYRGGNHVATLQGGADRVFSFFGKHSRPEAKGGP